MRKLKGLISLHSTFVDSINNLDIKLNEEIDKINLEYEERLLNEKIKLLLLICENEGLNFEEIKCKYLKPKELSHISIPEKKEEMKDDLLDRIVIDGIEYYYEPKDSGVVYDKKLNKVGIYKNNRIDIR